MQPPCVRAENLYNKFLPDPRWLLAVQNILRISRKLLKTLENPAPNNLLTSSE